MAAGKKRKIVAPQASRGNRSIELVQKQAEDEKPDPPDHLKRIARVESRSEFISVAEQIAQSTICFGNYKWPHADDHYPDATQAMMRFVDKYFPYAEGGPLYVDTPRSARAVERCEEKRRIFKKLKLRYVVIADGYLDPDGQWVEADRLDTVLEQLE